MTTGRPDLPATIAQALVAAQAGGLDRLDAQWLLGHRLGGRSSAWLIAHDTDPLPADLAAAYVRDCQRRAAGEPLAYLVGECGFHGLRLQVGPDVLVPRPDTETLVDWALALLDPMAGAAPRVIDLGTGSGAIALAVARHCPLARVAATDVSAAALAVARANASALTLAVEFHEGSWWQAVPAHQRFDLVLSNPPYIAGDDPHLTALQHEPLLALTPGGDGLDALRQIIGGAPRHLAPGGWLLLEHGWDQAEAVAALLDEAGFVDTGLRRDIEQRPRCSGGRWQGTASGP